MSPGGASVTAVIAAAGSGERLRAGGPKAFVHIAGRPMVEWSIEAFRAAGVAAIVVAVPPGHSYEPAVVEPHGADAPEAPLEVRVLAGGETRSASVSNALEVVETELVAIHDAARPLLTPELVQGVVAALSADAEAAGAIAAAPVTDTVKRVAGREGAGGDDEADGDGASGGGEGSNAAFPAHRPGNADLVVEETVDRATLWAAQTPQVFRVEALRKALGGAVERDSAATDEAMLVEAAGGRVLIHPVEAENMKVTTALDLRVAEQLLTGRG